MGQVPLEFGFEPRSPKYGPFSVLGLFDTNCAQCVPFLASFRLFLRHIVELEGNNELFVTGQSRRPCSVATACLRVAVLTGFRGRFEPKKAVLGH